MKTQFLLIAAGTLVCTALFVTPASSHHSFAMYDQEKTLVMTGVMKQFVGQANHAELHFYLVAPDRKGIAKSADGKKSIRHKACRPTSVPQLFHGYMRLICLCLRA